MSNNTLPNDRPIRPSLHWQLTGALGKIGRWNSKLQWKFKGQPTIVHLLDAHAEFDEIRTAAGEIVRLLDEMQNDLEHAITQKGN